ncbi:MAG: DUF4230 domain-containing protein [Oscillospiraceae bacterium]|nr:DUF4230 domain-containing protein [Oscillospiraceae bacterium]
MSRRGKRILATFLMILFFVAVIIGMRFYYRRQIETLEDEIEKSERDPDVSSVIKEEKVFLEDITLSGETIQEGLKDIGKLVTAEYYFTHVETFESQVDLFGLKIPGTRSSYVYSYDGSVIAGVDFNKILVEKDDVKRTITIHLPKVEIISTEIDPDSFLLYGEKKSIFNPFEVEDFALSQSDMIRIEQEKAVEEGLLERAAENAEQILLNFLSGSFGLERYEIKVVFAK